MEWLQVAAPLWVRGGVSRAGGKWLQVEWLQVAAGGFKWLPAEPSGVASSGCGGAAGGFKWLKWLKWLQTIIIWYPAPSM